MCVFFMDDDVVVEFHFLPFTTMKMDIDIFSFTENRQWKMARYLSFIFLIILFCCHPAVQFRFSTTNEMGEKIQE